MAKHRAATSRSAKTSAKGPPARKGGHTAWIYALDYGSTPNSLKATPTAQVPVGHGQVLAPDLTAVVPYMIEAESYLLTYSSRSRHYDIYKVEDNGKALRKTGDGTLQYRKDDKSQYTLLRPFILGGEQYLVAYEPKGGTFDYFRLDGTRPQAVATYNYTIGLDNQSQAFTEIHVFNIRYNLFLFAYDIESGKMIIFQVSVPPIGPRIYTVPYMNASSTWAPGWVRFACFAWGGENFFLKTNIKEHAVNIDHIFDEPLDGTHPVGDELPLDQTLTAVAPFSLDFALYFLTFQKRNGALTFNRFHSDALGWTVQASNLDELPKSTTLITPFLLSAPKAKNQQMRHTVQNTSTFVLVY